MNQQLTHPFWSPIKQGPDPNVDWIPKLKIRIIFLKRTQTLKLSSQFYSCVELKPRQLGFPVLFMCGVFESKIVGFPSSIDVWSYATMTIEFLVLNFMFEIETKTNSQFLFCFFVFCCRAEWYQRFFIKTKEPDHPGPPNKHWVWFFSLVQNST